MNGQFVFKNAVVRFSEVIMEGLAKNDLKTEDIDMLIPHQANLRISQFVQRKFGLSDDKVYNNIQKYGNTTAASIPIALTEAWENGKIKEGDTVVLAAFGSGFTWASSIIKWQ
jgi:3-oxoacyl-[acyl-carrier-protein] synthase-3